MDTVAGSVLDAILARGENRDSEVERTCQHTHITKGGRENHCEQPRRPANVNWQNKNKTGGAPFGESELGGSSVCEELRGSDLGGASTEVALSTEGSKK